MNANKILVTGGAGFIGSHIAEALLLQRYEVHILDNLSVGRRENVPSEAIFHEIDIRDKQGVEKLFAQHKFPVVFHQAAQMSIRGSVKDPLNDTDINVRGLITLMEAGRQYGLEKVIFASSGGAIYGDPIRIPQDEDHPRKPISPYGISKLTCEEYLRFYRKIYGIAYNALRYANVYGPRQNPESGAAVIAIFMEKLLSGVQPVINGTGNQTRDYVYISDVVAANMCALEYHGVGPFNVGTSKETDVNTIFRLISEICQSDIQEIHGSGIAGDQEQSVLDNSRSREVLGWEPRVTLGDGLRRTFNWYMQERKMVTVPAAVSFA
jgi:UDP-glucose 4-epimerase